MASSTLHNSRALALLHGNMGAFYLIINYINGHAVFTVGSRVFKFSLLLLSFYAVSCHLLI